MNTPRKDWSEERGGRIDPMTYPADEGHATDDERVDEAIAESFPASDPPSWTNGVDKEEREVKNPS